MTSYPFWVTLSNLGTFPAGHSFTSNPLVLTFGETNNQPCVVSLLNGQLPPGAVWKQEGFAVRLYGQISASQNQTFDFTFRLNNGQFSSDRTFTIGVSVPAITSFEWITPNSDPLGFVSTGSTTNFQVQAQSVPSGAIVYQLGDISGLTQGVAISSNSGELEISLAWASSTSYLAGRDLVYNFGQLYECVISGSSAPSVGPVGLGSTVVDSRYEPWQPTRFYAVNSTVTNDVGKVYVAVGAGVSAAGLGPTGEGSGISDGSVIWNWVGQAPVWSSVPAGTTLAQNVEIEATTHSQTISRVFVFEVLSTPFEPVWITPSGSLGTVERGQEFVLQLEATDPDQLAITWSSSNLPTWLNLTNIGLLWGTAPMVSTNTVYNFDVSASDGVQTVIRSFTVEVVENEIELSWVTHSDLGSVTDGAPCNKSVQAVSTTQGLLITYGLSGGMIPPNVIVDYTTGALQGLVEYHASAKTYQFDITASDGQNSIVKQFSLTVEPQNHGMHVNLTIPLLSEQRFDFVSQNNSSLIDDNLLYLPNDQGWGRTLRPSVGVAGGIKKENLESLRSVISNWTHNFKMVFDQISLQPLSNSEFDVVSLGLKDSSSLTAWAPNTVYPVGTRVSNPSGERYVVVRPGVSGDLPPRGGGTRIVDNTVIWSFDSVPLTQVDRTYPLPWYSYHDYIQGQTVISNGLVFRAQNNGRSGGVGPQVPNLGVVDNQVIWDHVASGSSAANNTYWPALVRNIRQASVEQVGWSSGWGTGASASATVDSVRGSVVSVAVASGGTGYFNSPQVAVVGLGTGTVCQALISPTSVTIIASDAGFSEGDILSQTFESNSNPVTIRLTSVDGLGRALTAEIAQSSLHTRLPSNPVVFSSTLGSITVRLDAGVAQVNVIQGGRGHGPNTTVSFAGKELNPITNRYIDQFELGLALAYTQSSGRSSVVSDLLTAENPFRGQTLVVGLLQASVQGIQWQGHTRLDQDLTTWDCDHTRLVEFDTATETIWEQNQTVWDQNSTTFDLATIRRWPDYSDVYFDDNQTVFDWYATLFDATQPVYSSRWSKQSFWYFGKPQNIPL